MTYKHFCSSCGKQYEDESKNSHTCPACREAKRKANQKASALSAKKRAKALGLVERGEKPPPSKRSEGWR